MPTTELDALNRHIEEALTRGMKMVLACTNASGEPDFAFTMVQCSRDQYDTGVHYDLARAWALESDYEGPFIVWDEIEAQDWLLERFLWDSADLVNP